MTAKNRKVDFALHDTASCSAPRLFKSLKPGPRKSFKIRWQCPDGRIFDIYGHYELGADDLRVLHGLVALAGLDGTIISPSPKTEEGRRHREVLDMSGGAENKNAMRTQTSFRRLALTIGLAENTKAEDLRASIERLYLVQIIERFDGRSVGRGHLLSGFGTDEKAGRVDVALNWRIYDAITGGQHVRINLEEVREIQNDVALILHQRLCAQIRAGHRHRYYLDSLAEYVWDAAENSATARKRRGRVRQALDVLKGLGWSIEEYTGKRGPLIFIGRPPESRNAAVK